MSLASAIAREMQPPGPKCAVATVMKMMDPDDVATLTVALGDKDVTAAAIGRALRSIGVDVSAFSLSRHRKGECSCG